MDYNAELFIKLYSKMALALGVTPSPAPVSSDPDMVEVIELGGPVRRSSVPNQETKYLLGIYNPGQFIPADMNPLDKDDLYALSVLLDVVPQFSWVFKPASTTVSNTYHSILECKDMPLTELTPEEKKKLETAQETMTKYEEEYYEYQGLYFEALDAYDVAYAEQENGGPSVPRSVKEKVKSALQRWRAHHKEAYESAVAVTYQYEALEPASFWDKLAQRYESGTQKSKSGVDFQVMGFSPPYKSWFQDAGWTKFTFDQKDMDNQKTSDVIGVAGKLEGDFGLFKVSGDGKYQEDSKFEKVKETSLYFSCELMRVSLDRFWMNPLVFHSSAWRWRSGTPFYGTLLSDGGDISGEVAPKGAMTVIPTAFILSRKLEIKGTFQDTLVDELNREIDANASVGIGPFNINGKVNIGHHESRAKGSIASNHIEAKDVQIIAMVCEVLSKCPDPDNTLPWP